VLFTGRLLIVAVWPVMLRFTIDRICGRPSEEIAMPDDAPAAEVNTDNTHKPSVLFLCVHNAGRSQMAAGLLRHAAGDRVEVFSGGSNPGTEVNAAAVAAMAELGIDISGEHPKPWTDGIARAADVIVTMGCGDTCPMYPGKRYEDWELADPAGQPLPFVREVRNDIAARVDDLLDSLGLGT